MEREMNTLTATPLEMEIMTGATPLPPAEAAERKTLSLAKATERKILSFRTPQGYFSLTDTEENPEGDASVYHDVIDVAYEDDSLSLYFDREARFQGEYDVVILHWHIDGKIIDFLAGYLFLGTPLRLALNTDAPTRTQ